MMKRNKASQRMTGLLSKSQQNALPMAENLLDRHQVGIEIALLSEREKQIIEKLLLENYTPEQEQVKVDVTQHAQQIFKLTSEIRSISAQSLLLHGERIQQAQIILRDYKFGAFTQWLIQTYGNRQTPYSMLKYYEFHLSLSSADRPLLGKIPKRAAYRLAMIEGDRAMKEQILQAYRGENQQALLQKIESRFCIPKRPLRRKPKRQQLIDEQRNLCKLIADQKEIFTDEERQLLIKMGQILQLIGKKEYNL